MATTSGPSGQQRLITRLQAIAVLDDADLNVLSALPITVRRFTAGQDIVHQGGVSHESCVVIDGFLQRHKEMPGGRRQILAFHVPGDVPDLQSLHLPVLDHTLAAVTASTIGAIAHSALQGAIDARPAIGRALWREALIDAAKFREWIANLGGRPALARMAHLFCELHVRGRAVGVNEPGTLPMPLTQVRLAEALGLSLVHVNRTMAQLRKRGLIASKGRALSILDWPGLQEVAEFDPDYLHLREPI